MSAKGLVVRIVPVLFFVANVCAQVNDVSASAGRVFVSTETVPSTNLRLHFGNPASFEFDYSRLLLRRGIFGLYGEVPVAIYLNMNVNYYYGTTPKDISALFITPSARLNFFSGDSVTPWVSVGGGYGHFWNSSNTLYGNPDPSSGSSTGVVQFGAGIDVWLWRGWGARFEARDFYSGNPDLNVAPSNSRQHNYYVGLGVARRF